MTSLWKCKLCGAPNDLEVSPCVAGRGDSGEAADAPGTGARSRTQAEASGVLDQQRRRHHAQLWVIARVRWQRRLARLTDEAASSAPGTAARRLEQLAAITREGKELLAKWEADADTAGTREGARCIAHTRELLARCEQLRQGIVVHEAMLTIRGIAPADDVERRTGLAIEPLESLQTDLGEGGSLARALAGLELEHERLRDDDQEARDVDRFLGELERGPA